MGKNLQGISFIPVAFKCYLHVHDPEVYVSDPDDSLKLQIT